MSSYDTQMAGLAVHIFVSATAGIAITIAVIRGFVRGISEETLHNRVREHREDRQFGFLGAPRVNVLVLNMELDTL